MHVCGMVATTLLVLATVWALFGGWLAGVLLLLLFHPASRARIQAAPSWVR